MLGWIIAGIIAVGIGLTIITFWEEIKEWLNNTAANVVEQTLGYGARHRMHRAIAKVDRVMNVVRNRTTVYTKRHALDTHFDKVELLAEANSYEISADVLKEIQKQGVLVQEFEYNG